MESNTIKSEWYHSYARFMIASVEWPVARIFNDIKLTVDNPNFKLSWHEVHAERVTMSLDVAARSHYGVRFIFVKYFVVLGVAAAIAWHEPSQTFAWVFLWIATCCGNVYNFTNRCLTKVCVIVVRIICSNVFWFPCMVTGMVVAICWQWFGSSGTEPGTST